MKAALVLLMLLLQPMAPSPSRANEDAEARRLFYLALDRMLESQTRVMTVADRMRIAGAGLCGAKVEPVLGVYAADRHTFKDLYPDVDYVEPFIDAAAKRYDLNEKPQVLAIAPGLPAHVAGLEVGDVIAAVDGREPHMRGDLVLTREDARNGVVPLGILRDGAPLQVDVAVQEGCSIPNRYMFGTAVNAFAMSFGNLTGVYFFGGLLGFLPEDDPFAIIVGHEFAHLVRSHTGHLRTSRRYESEADYLGLYFAARAGYDVSVAPGVWERMARANPFASVERGFYSHAMSAERSLALRSALAEIDAKRSRGAALAPEEGRFALRTPEVPEDESESRREALRSDALDVLRSQQARIAEISHRLAVAGAELCGQSVAPVLGAIVGRRQDFSTSRKEQVEAAFGVGDSVTVFAVASGSPAHRAGLAPGDQIRSLDGGKLRKSEHAFDRMRHARRPVVAHVRRGDATMDLEIPIQRACAFGTLVTPRPDADTQTHANKKEMIVPTGLLRYVEDDDELAIALSHQLGHQILGRFRSVEHEASADELGLRIAASAGFDVSKAIRFWDRWTAEQFWKISTDMEGGYIPHGGMSRRAPAIRKAAAELEARDQAPGR